MSDTSRMIALDERPNPGSDEAEKFVDVPGFEGLYEISTHGRVRSLRYFGYAGKIGFLKPRWSKGPRNNGRYASVRLIDKTRGLDEQRLIHRMVALAFVSCPDPSHDEVNHIDGNTENNQHTNLEWATRSMNQKHAVATGLALAPVSPQPLDSGTKYFWKHKKGAVAHATPAMMNRLHGLDTAYAHRMIKPEKYPHHLTHKGWRIIPRPKPGSDDAIAVSCCCPVLDNGQGRGVIINGERHWWRDETCPVHGIIRDARAALKGDSDE